MACPVCFETDVPKATFELTGTHSWDNTERCDAHGICKPCMQRYIIVTVLDEGMWHIRCPGVGCSYRLTDGNVRCALEGSKRVEDVLGRLAQARADTGLERLRRVLADDVVEMPLLDCQACPQCFVLTYRANGCLHLCCRCGADYCFGCGSPLNVVGLDWDHYCACYGWGPAPLLCLWLSTQGNFFEYLPVLERLWEVKTVDPGFRSFRLAEAEAERIGVGLHSRTLDSFMIGASLFDPDNIEPTLDPEDKYGYRMRVGWWNEEDDEVLFERDDRFHDLEDPMDVDELPLPICSPKLRNDKERRSIPRTRQVRRQRNAVKRESRCATQCQYPHEKKAQGVGTCPRERECKRTYNKQAIVAAASARLRARRDSGWSSRCEFWVADAVEA